MMQDNGNFLPSPVGSSELENELRVIIASLPPASFAFAYGSAVFPQLGFRNPPRQRMLDFILAVDCPQSWHAENMAINPDHYAVPLRWLGPKAASSVQTCFGAGVYFNTLFSTPRSFKYGVIALSDLEMDLRNWESLYVAGRMHKPVRVLSNSPPPRRIFQAAEDNLAAATSAALLTLPPRFAENDLYCAAAGLSYTGDVRMALRAEVGDKVRNIVSANIDRFRGLYRSAVENASVRRTGSGIWEREIDPAQQRALLKRLPDRVLSGVSDALGVSGDLHSDRIAELSRRDATQLRTALLTTVAAIVSKSSLRQTVKGLATAGLGTSIRYAAQKFSKALKAKPRKTLGSLVRRD